MRLQRFLRGLFIVSAVLVFIFSFFWMKFLLTPVVQSQNGVTYFLQPGSSIEKVMSDFTKLDINPHPIFFTWLVNLRGSGGLLKTGEYFFPFGSKPKQILQQITTGKGVIYHVFTIIAGWNFRQIKEALQSNKHLRHTLQKTPDHFVMQKINATAIAPEGQFFPDSYYYTLGSSDISILKRAAKKLTTTLNLAWSQRASGLPFHNAYEALIAASLVEKEAHLEMERALIASVLINRLRKGMLLQFDPTVIYAMGNHYAGKIYKKDLTHNNLYNTYLNKGLPPTPIAVPSLNSIIAVLHPASTEYLYFVARGDGSHQFSKNLKEHHAAVLISRKNKEDESFNFLLVKQYLKKATTANFTHHKKLGLPS